MAAQNCADAGVEFVSVGRLGHIVVGAQLQAKHRCELWRARGHHHHRHAGLGPDGAQQVQPVAIGQIQIKNDQINIQVDDAGASLGGTAHLFKTQIATCERRAQILSH